MHMTMILPIIRRRFWQRLRRCVAKSAVRRALLLCCKLALEYHENGDLQIRILAPSLGRADEVFLLQPAHIPWQGGISGRACVQPAHQSGDVDTLADMVVKTAQPGDHIL